MINLNIANGNNTSITFFYAHNNPNLSCIQVDDVAWSISNWTNIDVTTSFSISCNQTSVGINETNGILNVVNIYPNPTTGELNIKTNTQINTLEIYNVTGQEVATFNNVSTIDISSLPNGIYTAKILSGNSITTKKIIKE